MLGGEFKNVPKQLYSLRRQPKAVATNFAFTASKQRESPLGRNWAFIAFESSKFVLTVSIPKALS